MKVFLSDFSRLCSGGMHGFCAFTSGITVLSGSGCLGPVVSRGAGLPWGGLASSRRCQHRRFHRGHCHCGDNAAVICCTW